MRILILDAGNTSSYHLMRSLARAGHEVHLSSPDKAIWFRSRYCGAALRSPSPEDRPRFAAYLLELVSATRYGLLLFCGDLEAEVVWQVRNELEERVPCFLPDPSTQAIAFSKVEAYRHAAQVSTPAPITRIPSSTAELRSLAEELGVPLVVKGERGSAGRRVRFVRGADQLERAYREISELERPEGGRTMVQEFVPGAGYVVHALFHRGEPIALCSHRKDREYPRGTGVTSHATTVHHPALDEAALHFLRSLRWNGLVKLDFLRDARDGSFKFVEIDPRVSASIDITRAAGCDQARLLCDLAAGREVRPCLEYEAGVRYWWLFPRDVLAMLDRPAGLAALALGLARRSGGHFDLGLDDPRVALGALRLLGSFVRRDLGARRRPSRVV